MSVTIVATHMRRQLVSHDTGSNAFSCSYCCKMFSQPNNCHTHQQAIHSGDSVTSGTSVASGSVCSYILNQTHHPVHMSEKTFRSSTLSVRSSFLGTVIWRGTCGCTLMKGRIPAFAVENALSDRSAVSRHQLTNTEKPFVCYDYWQTFLLLSGFTWRGPLRCQAWQHIITEQQQSRNIYVLKKLSAAELDVKMTVLVL